MKKFLQNLSMMKIVCILVAVIIVINFISWLPQLGMKDSARPEIGSSALAAGLGAIDVTAKETLVAENGGRQLYVDPSNLNIKVVDVATQTYWESKSQTDESATSITGPIAITYIDGAGAEQIWSGYDFSVADDGGYRIERIENGFRAELHFASEESTNLEEYMPKEVSTEKYQEYFIDKVNALVASGELTEDDQENFNKALEMIYALSDNGKSYYNKYAGTPPVSATNILIQLSKAVGYSVDLIREDSGEYGFTFEVTENADFTIPVEFTLDNGDLVVNIPTGKIITGNEDFLIKSIHLLPNFGLVEAEETDDGFIFVPDGSGALFNLNTYDSGYTEYARAVYDNTYYDTVYNQSEFRENITMPVFGMGSMADRKVKAAEPEEEGEEAEGEEADSEEAEEAEEEPAEEPAEAEEPSLEAAEGEEAAEVIEVIPDEAPTAPVEKPYNGFMGIIESGDITATINVKLAADVNSDADAPYNKVFPSFDVMQVSSVKVFGPYSENDARFTAKTEPFDFDCRVRYKLYANNANYFNMAQTYRDYLIATEGLTEKTDEQYAKAPGMFLDVISALTVDARIVGVPYDKTISMTSYDELAEIYGDLKDVDTIVNYRGAFNGGIYNTVNTSAKLTGKNGNKATLDSLLNDHWDTLYLGVNPSEVYKKTKSFAPRKHALITFNGDPMQTFRYYIPNGQFDMTAEGYYTVAPKYLTHVVEEFSKDAAQYKNLGIGDLGNLVYENLNADDEWNPYESEAIIQNALATLAADRKLILDNPNADRVKYATVSSDVSRESSDYGLIAENVPFRQIVLNGLTNYTTLSVNTSSSNKAYFTLQALELASMPKFTVTYKKVDQLKEANYNELFATEYEIFADQIKEQYATIKAEFEKIGTTKITHHRVLDGKVYETTYETGVKVITNYNTYAVDTEYGALAAQSYLIVEGGE